MADEEQLQSEEEQGLSLTQTDTPDSERINRTTVLIGIGAVALFVVALIAFGFLGGGENQASQEPSSGQEQIAQNPDEPAFQQQGDAPQQDQWRASPDGATSDAVEQAREAQRQAAQRRSGQPPGDVQTPSGRASPPRGGGRQAPQTPTSGSGTGSGSGNPKSPRQQAYQQALSSSILAGGQGASELQNQKNQQQAQGDGQQSQSRAAPAGPGSLPPMQQGLTDQQRRIIRQYGAPSSRRQGQSAAGPGGQPPGQARNAGGMGRGGSRRDPSMQGSSMQGSPAQGRVGTPPINGTPRQRSGTSSSRARGRGGGSRSSMGGVSSTPGRSQFQSQATQKAAEGVYIASEVNKPISPYEIDAGTVVPAVLETALNSDLPGEIVARVTRPVYGRKQKHVLIPAGTKLIGSYSSSIQVGQSRALLAWTRMVFPNGHSVPLPGLSAKNREGATGLEGEVNNHYGRMIATAGAVALVGAGAQLAVPGNSGSRFGAAGQDPQSVIARQIALELSRLGTQMLQRQMEIEPTLTVEQGHRFYVYFNRDLAFEAPYGGEAAQPRFRGFESPGGAKPPRRVYTRQVNDSTYQQRTVPIYGRSGQ